MKITLIGALFVCVSAIPAMAYPSFECVGKQTGKFYDASIIDVGDKEGVVLVNNGGVPQTFSAEYKELANGNHRWVFGFELYNESVVPVLSQIMLKPIQDGKTSGSVSYFEHDYDSQSHQLIREQVNCHVSK